MDMDQITSAFATLQSVQDAARLSLAVQLDDTPDQGMDDGLSPADRERLQAARAARSIGAPALKLGRTRVVTKKARSERVAKAKKAAAEAAAGGMMGVGAGVGSTRKVRAKVGGSETTRERMEAMWSLTAEREEEAAAGEHHPFGAHVATVKAAARRKPTAAAAAMKAGPKRTTDSVRIYLKEIGEVVLLTAQQEIELARLVQDLLAMEAVQKRLGEELARDATPTEWAAGLGMDTRCALLWGDAKGSLGDATSS
jgi:hypothetical protein